MAIVEFKPLTHVIYLAVLVALLFLYTVYDDSMSEKAHKKMLEMQKDYPESENTKRVALALDFDDFTSGIYYFMVPFILYPFVCRQRFFYYVSGITFIGTFKSVIKLLFHAPRPVMLWSDLQCYGASTGFALPSGHASRMGFFVTFIILDTFFSSNHSRRSNPSSNAFSLS